jgi:hypothetical protein
MGRHKLDIDESKVENYARLGLSMRDIALLLGCAPSVIRHRFSETYKRARAERRAAIYKMQWDSAKGDKENSPNVTMQIWLGKNELNQTDKQTHEHKGHVRTTHDFDPEALKAFTDDELLKFERAFAGGARRNGAPGRN